MSAPAPEPSDRAGLSETEQADLAACLRATRNNQHGRMTRLVAVVERILAVRLAAAEAALFGAQKVNEMLRAQVAAVEGVYEAVLRRSVRTNGWTPDDWEDFTEGALHDLRAALGDPRPWVDRLKTEGAKEVLDKVQAVYDIQCPVGPKSHYVGDGARVAHQWWQAVLGGLLVDERARVLRDGEPS